MDDDMNAVNPTQPDRKAAAPRERRDTLPCPLCRTLTMTLRPGVLTELAFSVPVDAADGLKRYTYREAWECSSCRSVLLDPRDSKA